MTTIQCECGRGSYDTEDHHSCYECYLDRRATYDTCIYCGRWHSPAFDTCYQCRTQHPDRTEAGKILRQLILHRDNYTCRNCGAREGDTKDDPFALPIIDVKTLRPVLDDDGEPIYRPNYAHLQVDHIKPCAEGGTADEWNLQVLCGVCNRIKGRTWGPYTKWHKVRTDLCRRYYLIAKTYFGEEEHARFMNEVRKYRLSEVW